MESILYEIYSNFEVLLLIFIRITGLFIMSPIFGRNNVPIYLKIGLALFISYIVIVFIPVMDEIIIKNFFHLAYYIGKEMTIGFIMGYITTLTFSALLIAGQIIDTQIGFGIVNVMDPQINAQVPLIGNIKNILALLLFFVIDGHHTLINLIIDSFSIIPLGDAWFNPELSLIVFNIFIRIFNLGVKIAIPIIAAAFIAEVGLGIILRTVPQMNVFVIGIPLKIIIGLVAILIIIPMYINILSGLFNDMFIDISTLIQEMT